MGDSNTALGIAATDKVLQAAMGYAARGLRVVPLHTVNEDGSCTCKKGAKCPQNSRGKHPRITKWQDQATSDEETVQGWFDQWPQSNVGVQLGAASGIIDIEFDSPEGRATAVRLLGDCITPTYTSGRSTHRLFKWSDEFDGLPASITRYGLEFRLGVGGLGAQSVFPPSRHHSGVQYQWLPGLSPSEVEPMEVPERAVALLWNSDPADDDNGSPRRDLQKLYEGTSEPGRNTAMTKIIGKKLRALVDLDDENLDTVMRAARQINASNRPPMPDSEVDEVFQSILARESKRRVGYVPPPQMRLIIVDSDPLIFELHSAMFGKAPGGCLRLSAADLASKYRLKIKAIEQASCVVPPRFLKGWDGLLSQLMAGAERRAAPAESRRDLTVAQRVYDRLRQATPVSDDKLTDAKVKRLPDGSVIFLFNQLFDDLSFTPDKITRHELSELLENLKCGWLQARVRKETSPLKFKKVTAEGMARLEAMFQDCL